MRTINMADASELLWEEQWCKNDNKGSEALSCSVQSNSGDFGIWIVPTTSNMDSLHYTQFLPIFMKAKPMQKKWGLTKERLKKS